MICGGNFEVLPFPPRQKVPSGMRADVGERSTSRWTVSLSEMLFVAEAAEGGIDHRSAPLLRKMTFHFSCVREEEEEGLGWVGLG